MDPSPGARTSAKRAEQPSHADLRHDIDMQTLVLQRIEGKLDSVIKTVGFHGTDERGQLIGTGIAGDLARLKRHVGRYDGWVKYAAGALASVSVLGAVIWWLVQNRLGFLR
jgi:hypothetical protein